MACLISSQDPSVTGVTRRDSVTGVTGALGVTDVTHPFRGVTVSRHANQAPSDASDEEPSVTLRGLILGIDPGLSGAYAILEENGHLIDAGDLPLIGTKAQCRIDAANFAALIGRLPLRFAVVEQVNAMPGQGVSSMFRFGQSLGTVVGVLAACSIPIVWVTPSKWKNASGLSSDKEHSRQRAIETWPASSPLFARRKDHGRAEAALIASWGIRHAQ